MSEQIEPVGDVVKSGVVAGKEEAEQLPQTYTIGNCKLDARKMEKKTQLTLAQRPGYVRASPSQGNFTAGFVFSIDTSQVELCAAGAYSKLRRVEVVLLLALLEKGTMTAQELAERAGCMKGRITTTMPLLLSLAIHSPFVITEQGDIYTIKSAPQARTAQILGSTAAGVRDAIEGERS